MGKKLGRGRGSLFLGRAGSPSRPTSIPSGILVHPAVWPQWTLAENWGLCPIMGGGAVSPSNTMSRRSRPASVPTGILIHSAVWSQYTWVENWRAPPLFGEGLGPHLAQCGMDQDPPLCQVHLDPSSRLATTDMGRKLGRGLRLLFGKGS